MIPKFFKRSVHDRKAKRRVLRKAAALPPDHQALTAVYAMGIRDGLRIAADIRRKTHAAEGDTPC